MPIPEGFSSVLVRIALTGDSDEMAVTFGMELTSGYDQSSADVTSATVSDWIRSLLNSSYSYNGIVVTAQLAGDDPVIFESSTDAGAGLGAGNCVPQNTAYLLRKRTALGGRRNRGRMFVPGVPEAAVSNAGELTAPTVSDINDVNDVFLASLATFLTPMVILHRNDPFLPPTEVTALICQSTVATQRRRLR